MSSSNQAKQKSRPVLFLLALCLPGFAAAEERPDPPTLALGARAPEFSLRGTDGRTWSLEDFAGDRLLVVVFSCNHCPTAQAYEDRLIRVCLDYGPKKVGLVMISPNSPKALNLAEMGYTDVGDALEDMKIRARDKKFPFPYLYDGDEQKAALAYGPVATPHVFVFDEKRELQYAGRVDEREKPGTGNAEDLKQALDALLAGKEPSLATTRVFGCSIIEPGGKVVYRRQGIIDPLALRKAIVEHPLLGRYY